MNLTRHVKTKLNQFKYGFYNILKARNSKLGQYLPLYSSTVFTSNQLKQSLNNQTAVRRYKEILPSILISATGAWQRKFITLKLQFNPELETLKMVTLRSTGFLSQQFHIDNIIPWSYADMMASSKWPQPRLPTFLDGEMFYFNAILREVMMFENDGKWDESTVNHPKLSLEARADQKRWFDHQRII